MRQSERIFYTIRSSWTGQCAALFLLLIVLTGLAAPFLPIPEPNAIDLSNKFSSPTFSHWLGTDSLGRDIFSRLIWGIRSSVFAALIASIITALLGTIWGIISAASNDSTDNFMMRICDFWMSFPSEVMIIAVVGLLGPGLENIAIACLIAKWPWYARMMRTIAKRIQLSGFVDFSIISGADRSWIIQKHLLPNTMADFFILATLDTGSVILLISSLSFLGLGVSAPTAEWGMMLAEAKNVMTLYPWQMVPSGLMILLTVTSLHFLGDTLARSFELKQYWPRRGEM